MKKKPLRIICAQPTCVPYLTPPREGKKIFEEGNNICAEEKKNKKRKRRETFVEVKNIFAEEKKGGTY